jgi:hypothetical protein
MTVNLSSILSSELISGEVADRRKFLFLRLSSEFSLRRRMGINGQKRKNKQGPVPSLEESLPKKFKSAKYEKPLKGKKGENGVKKTNGDATVEKPKKAELTVDFDDDVSSDEDNVQATKASLFDDDDLDGEDEFEGLEDDEEYASFMCPADRVATLYQMRTTLLTRALKKKMTSQCSATLLTKRNLPPQTWKPFRLNSTHSPEKIF